MTIECYFSFQVFNSNFFQNVPSNRQLSGHPILRRTSYACNKGRPSLYAADAFRHSLNLNHLRVTRHPRDRAEKIRRLFTGLFTDHLNSEVVISLGLITIVAGDHPRTSFCFSSRKEETFLSLSKKCRKCGGKLRQSRMALTSSEKSSRKSAREADKTRAKLRVSRKVTPTSSRPPPPRISSTRSRTCRLGTCAFYSASK